MSVRTLVTEYPTVITALGEGPELTSTQLEHLNILLDPQNDPTQNAQGVEDMLDELEIFTGSELSEVTTVAERLREYHSHNEGVGFRDSFGFEFVGNTDGDIDSYNVLTAVGDSSTWLILSGDSKYIFPERYQLKSLRAALFIIGVLTENHAQLLKQRSLLIGN